VKVRSGAVKTTGELLVELAPIVPSDNAFEEAFKIANVTKATLARYLLMALEKGRKNEAEPEFVPNDNEEQVNLEHVLPKGAREADWGAAFTADEAQGVPASAGQLGAASKRAEWANRQQALLCQEGRAERL